MAAIAGFVWQAYKALEYLFSNDVESVTLEGSDDVVVCYNGTTAVTAVQTKHHSGPGVLTVGDAELWRVLRNWLLLEFAVGTGSRPKAYELLTTEELSADLAVLGAETSDRSAPEIDNLVSKLDSMATSKVKDVGVQAGRDNWRQLEGHQKRAFLRKCRIVSELDGVAKHADVLAELLTARFLLESHTHLLAEGLQVWFVGHSMTQVAGTHSPTPILRKAAYGKFFELLAAAREDMPDAQYAGFDQFPPQPAEAMFIKQLRAIDAVPGELTHAHQMFVKARLERDYLAKHDRGLGWIRDFRANLLNVWSGHHASCAANGDSEIKQGKEVLVKCRSTSSEIGLRAARVHEVEGNFHDLSNEGELGWHPKWKEVT